MASDVRMRTVIEKIPWSARQWCGHWITKTGSVRPRCGQRSYEIPYGLWWINGELSLPLFVSSFISRELQLTLIRSSLCVLLELTDTSRICHALPSSMSSSVHVLGDVGFHWSSTRLDASWRPFAFSACSLAISLFRFFWAFVRSEISFSYVFSIISFINSSGLNSASAAVICISSIVSLLTGILSPRYL